MDWEAVLFLVHFFVCNLLQHFTAVVIEGVEPYSIKKYILLLTIVCDIHYNGNRGDNVGEKKETLENKAIFQSIDIRRNTVS